MTLTPSPEQSAILDGARDSNDSIFIHAGAGCSKTTTLTMLSKVLPRVPSCVLVFNASIKKELSEKFPSHYEVMTFNALGQKAIGRFLNKQQIQVDKTKLYTLLKSILQEEGLILQGDKFQQVLKLCTFAMQEGLVPESFDIRGFIEDTPETWEELAEVCALTISGEEISLANQLLILSIKESLKGRISFDDQIYISVFFAKNFFPRFSQCLVDEAQDLSPLNREQIRYTCLTGRLVIVGDDKQAIYAFRGSDANSFINLRALRPSWQTYPLLTTFRCPKNVVTLANRYAIGFRANESNPLGTVRDLSRLEEPWCISDYLLSPSVAILCRNNAPLLNMAFSCLSNNIPCEYLGRDIGKSLERLVKSIAGTALSQSRDDFLARLQSWEIRETGKYLNNSDSIQDRCDSIRALFGTAHKDVYSVLQRIEELSKMTSGKLVLATGHKAKGLEWHTVVHLDPWRVPSKFALSKGGSILTQDLNVRHVITTRTQDTLVLANLKDHYHSEELENNDEDYPFLTKPENLTMLDEDIPF